MRRKAQGYSQQEVAAKLKIDRSTYAYYELGKFSPSITRAIEISRILAIEINDLLPLKVFLH